MADEREKSDEKIVHGQHERAGLSPEDPPVQPTGDSADTTDLSAVRADDELLDALGGAGGDRESPGVVAEDELNALLLAWRQEVDDEPAAVLVDTDTAVATIAAARPVPHRHRFLIPLATAAAVLAIAFTGTSLVARDSLPGDPLWALTKVLYADHARSVEAAAVVRTDLDTARVALAEGRVDEAKDALAKAGVVLPEVSTDDGRSELSEKHHSLLEELTSSPLQPTSGTVPRPFTSVVPSTVPSSDADEIPEEPADDTGEPTGPTEPVESTTTPVVPTTTSSEVPPPPPTSDTGVRTEPGTNVQTGETASGEETVG
ncbi:anti-sigma-D factor RsdA [Umezawaea beigongshangensis]|uniref:anti-sigma-D factor RsdA n=1 Tax=Umezawaea beigongshangensis TaxID=2780383 RepID=UPI0018F17A6F|nr:anti-sigma-D factor RsdA [Umezawaea beigongshangensis]